MRWSKIGRVFDPTKAVLPNGCTEFAQAPQALVLDDRIRVYFSTREGDRSGKFLSHVAFVDLDPSFNAIEVSNTPVLPLGRLGCFDEHGIFPFNVIRHGDEVRGYIGGWSRRVAVPVDGAIGVAVSRDDGRTFQRIGDGPVLAASELEPFMVADPFVQVVGTVHHMWYIFGTAWRHFEGTRAPERVYKIGHAISPDGIAWERDDDGRQIVSDRLGSDECQALPTVMAIGGRYHMLFCYRQASDFRTNPARTYRIGYAFSDDLATWTRDDSLAGIAVTPGAWDSDMLCYPHFFTFGGETYLLYNGNEFGRFGFGLARLLEA